MIVVLVRDERRRPARRRGEDQHERQCRTPRAKPQRERARAGKRRHHHRAQAVAGVKQHLHAAGALRLRVHHVVDERAVDGRRQRAVCRQPDHHRQRRDGRARHKAQRARAQLRKAPREKQPQAQPQRRAAQRQRVVCARHQAEHRHRAQQGRRKQQRARRALPLHAEHAHRRIQAEEREQVRVFLRQVAATHQRADERQIQKLRRRAKTHAHRPGDRVDHAQAGEEEEHLLNEHRQRAVAAGEGLRNRLQDEHQRTLVVEDLGVGRVAPRDRRAHRQVDRVVAADARPQRRVERVEDQPEADRQRRGERRAQHPFLPRHARPHARTSVSPCAGSSTSPSSAGSA